MPEPGHHGGVVHTPRRGDSRVFTSSLTSSEGAEPGSCARLPLRQIQIWVWSLALGMAEPHPRGTALGKHIPCGARDVR